MKKESLKKEPSKISVKSSDKKSGKDLEKAKSKEPVEKRGRREVKEAKDVDMKIDQIAEQPVQAKKRLSRVGSQVKDEMPSKSPSPGKLPVIKKQSSSSKNKKEE